MNVLIELASNWRKKQTRSGTGGVVIIHRSEVLGWCNVLGNPESWMAGCIAIDETGNQWVAVGGVSCSGAAEWKQVVARISGSESWKVTV